MRYLLSLLLTTTLGYCGGLRLVSFEIGPAVLSLRLPRESRNIQAYNKEAFSETHDSMTLFHDWRDFGQLAFWRNVPGSVTLDGYAYRLEKPVVHHNLESLRPILMELSVRSRSKFRPGLPEYGEININGRPWLVAYEVFQTRAGEKRGQEESWRLATWIDESSYFFIGITLTDYGWESRDKKWYRDALSFVDQVKGSLEWRNTKPVESSVRAKRVRPSNDTISTCKCL